MLKASLSSTRFSTNSYRNSVNYLHSLKKSGTVETTESSSTSKAAQVASNSLVRQRRSTSWLRRRNELYSLRNEMEALKSRIAVIQMRRSRIDGHSSVAEAWRPVVAAERKLCQAARVENERLKNELQLYNTAIKRLFELQRKAGAQRLSSIENSLVFYYELERRVNSRIPDLEAIITAARPSAGVSSTEHVNVCREHTDKTAPAVEFKQVRVLPYEESVASHSIGKSSSLMVWPPQPTLSRRGAWQISSG
ncbi:unnamed protein product [Phytophthora lilii]|uniref:Unnamed protein product n=1 Tax=Phytophthora lilii TaxID=2077276 RepID=A0A9W6U6G4_9STRA|nr:unnamed protein product [Phytophthora lilii]